ncbi:MAG: hypothetical protein ACOC95_02735 [Planctomycetota bacterium]
MVKKLLLVFGTLAVVVGGLVVYSRYVASDLPSPPVRASGDLPEIPTEGARVGGVQVGAAGEVWLAQTDPVTGLRTAVYRCREWQVEGDTHTLIEPDAEIYLSDGQTIRITADTAVVKADEVAGTLEPREGTLTGNVHIRVDTNTLRDDQRPAEEDRPGDFVHIRTGALFFSYDLFEVRAPGTVEVTGRDVSIRGEDLLLQWHTAPMAELRRLRLARGEKIEIRRSAEAAGPGDTDDKTQATEAQGAAPVDAEVQTPLVRAYRLVMADNIVVRRNTQRMEGADRLALVFAFEDDDERRSMGPPQGEARPTAPAATAPATAPAVASAPAEEAEWVTMTWTGRLEMVPVTQSTDLGDMPAPPPGEFALAAAGPELTLMDETMEEGADERMVARCGLASFSSAGDTVELTAGDRPAGRVDLTIARLGHITGPSVRLNDQDQTIALDGAGEFIFDTGDEAARQLLTGIRRTEAASAPAATQPDGTDGRITWQRGVTLRYAAAGSRRVPVSATFLGEARFTSADGATMGGDALIALFARAPRPDADEPMDAAALTAVYADGSARLVSADGRQSVGADWIEIPLRRTDDGRAVPRRLYALGNVAATLDNDDVTAGELLLEFAEADEAPSAIEAVAMGAWGDVRLKRRGDAAAPMTVRGEVFDGDLTAGRYVITGRPAEVNVDDQWLRGGEIVLTGERIGETLRLTEATVATGGMARLLLETDLSGADLAAPQSGYVQWDRQMSFRPGADEVVFAGNVRFDTAADLDEQTVRRLAPDSPGDHLRCDMLTVTLAEGEPRDEPTATTRPAEDAPLSMGRRLRGLAAEGNVQLLARRDDGQGHPVRRMQVEAEHFDWDAVAARVEVDGAGALSLEDYRGPSATTGGDTGVERPSQTVFSWRERMALVQTGGAAVEDDAPVAGAWEVTMTGDVQMTHRSGRQVVGLDKLPAIEPETLPEGRTTELDCRELIARLASRGTSDDRTGGGLDRDIELFQAIGDVVLREGPYEAQGGQIMYDDAQKTVMIYGGEDPVADTTTPARVYYDPPGHRQGSWTSSPAIRVRRVGHRYEVHAVEAAAGGMR